MDMTRKQPRVTALHAERAATSAVVCLHPSAGSGRQWRALAGELGAGHFVHAPDFSGIASRTSLDEDVSIAQGAIAAAGAPVHLIGHSYGAAVALLAALRDPDAVTSLVLYEPVPFWLLRDDARGAGAGAERSAQAWNEIRAVASGLAADHADGAALRAARHFVDYWSGAGAWASLGPRQQQGVIARMPGVLSNFDCLSAERVPLAAIARLPMPVMWLGGALTRNPPQRIGELLADALPQMARYTLPGAGHMGPVTHPRLVNALIAGFVAAQRPRHAARRWRRAA
jgi:pimeloyl-ACP methyl ester carboxylesterase